MKVLKEDSFTAKQIEKLEDFLRENNITINGIEYISILGRDFVIKDIGSSSDYATLPRSFDTQRLVVIE